MKNNSEIKSMTGMLVGLDLSDSKQFLKSKQNTQ